MGELVMDAGVGLQGQMPGNEVQQVDLSEGKATDYDINVLHVLDSPETGGATVAAESVIDLVGGSVCRHDGAGKLKQAHNTIGGYCSPGDRGRLRLTLKDKRPDIVHLHNFKEFGTAAIAACIDDDIPVVWSCYDYWPLCAKDNFYGPDCNVGLCSPVVCYQPKDKSYPWFMKLPLWKRQERVGRWMNKLSGIITLSEDSSYRLRYGGITVPTTVIPLPVMIPRDAMGDGERDHDLVLFVGGTSPNKGGDVFHKAIQIVQQQSPKTSCVDLRASTRLEALKWIAKARVLVVPEQWPNPGPVVIYEAALLQTQVVASRIGGIPAMLNGWGRTATPDSPNGFATQILATLAGSPDFIAVPHYPTIRSMVLEEYQRCIQKRR